MGTISCNTQENFYQLEINREINEKVVDKKENKIKKFSPKINRTKKLINSNRTHINKKENKSQNIKYKYLNNLLNPKRRTYSDDIPIIKKNNQIKKNIYPNKNTLSIIQENNIKLKSLIKSKLKKNNSNGKKIENKKSYNINSNINKKLNEEEIIDNNNDGFEQNSELLYSNINSDNQNKKKKFMKVKEGIIKVKKQLNNSRGQNNINNKINIINDNNKLLHNDKNIICDENYNDSNIDKNINKNKFSIINTKRNFINYSSLIPQVNIKPMGYGNELKNINNIENNKINNAIFINNSNVTISNDRTNIIGNNFKDSNEDSYSNMVKNSKNNSSNIDNSNLNEIYSNDYQKNNKDLIKEKFNNKFYTQSELDSNINENNSRNNQYFSQEDIDISQYNNKIINNEHLKNRKIINKLTEIKNKINNQNSTSIRKTYPAYKKFHSKTKSNENMDNRQIKKNIPTYRRGHSNSNNFHENVLNSSSYDNKKQQEGKIKNILTSQNSFRKSLYDSNAKSKNIKNNKFSFKRKKNYQISNKNTNINKFFIQQSYFNNSPKINTSELNIKNNNTKKNQRLFNFISKNIINNEIYDEQNIIEKKDPLELTLFPDNKENVIIDISNINKKESLISKDLFKIQNNKEILLDYNKIDNLTSNDVIYDGILFKVGENKNKGFKITERYFQLMKNCLKYYIDFKNAELNIDKPLVQFDIRHIKSINIINNDKFKNYKIKGKMIKFSFCIFLYQNDDFFAFVFNNEEVGRNTFNILNFLKKYYDSEK